MCADYANFEHARKPLQHRFILKIQQWNFTPLKTHLVWAFTIGFIQIWNIIVTLKVIGNTKLITFCTFANWTVRGPMFAQLVSVYL